MTRGGLLGLVLLGLLLAVAWWRVPGGPTPVAGVPASSAPGGEGVVLGRLPDSLPRVERLVRKASVGRVEVCGVGPVWFYELLAIENTGDDLLSPTPPAWSKALAAHEAAGRVALLSRLQAGDPQSRLAAAVMRGDLSTAAAMARSSTDASMYRLALSSCRSALVRSDLGEAANEGQLTGCRALSVDRLAQLMPGDMGPLLLKLSEMGSRSSTAEIDQLLYMLGQSHRLSDAERPLSQIVARSIHSPASPGEVAVMTEAIGMDLAASVDGTPLGVVRHCKPPIDANRRQSCERIAALKAKHAGDFLAVIAARRTHEQLGLPPPSDLPDRAELKRLQEAFSAASSGDVLSAPTCENYARTGALLVRMSQLGELAFARSLLRDPPTPLSPYFSTPPQSR